MFLPFPHHPDRPGKGSGTRVKAQSNTFDERWAPFFFLWKVLCDQRIKGMSYFARELFLDLGIGQVKPARAIGELWEGEAEVSKA